ncbi:hypothetical protein [Mucisphaera sp.]|uniref:hypothetical protein n=1 Tax=Mucisphaera sp. TaxID=2913024 RepID=UPI003D0BB83C
MTAASDGAIDGEMQRLGYAILAHAMPGSPHVDVMVEHPVLVRDPGARDVDARVLWTVRVGVRPEGWAGRSLVGVEAPLHRRVYLRRTGLTASGRGSVRALDRGQVRVRLWCGDRVELDFVDGRFPGSLSLRGLGGGRWRFWFVRAG